MSGSKNFILWEKLTYLWGKLDFLWEDIALVDEVRKGGSSAYYGDYEKNNPWKKVIENVGVEKADRFIKILCNVNGIDYEDVKLVKGGITITATHFEKTFQLVEKNVYVNIQSDKSVN